MKNLNLIISFFILSILTNAQIGIGVQNNGDGSILKFDEGCDNQGLNCQNKKGIILPIVNTTPTVNITNGTFILDKSDAIIKVYENNVWKKLSFLPGNLSSIINKTNTLEVGDGVTIGAPNTTVNGVLVLEATDKALVLPKINKPYETVPNPYPGMICYDTDSKSLMLFDGTYWNIWREKKN